MSFSPRPTDLRVNTIALMGLKDLSPSLEDGSGDYYREIDQTLPIECLCPPNELVGIYKLSFDSGVQFGRLAIAKF